MPVVDINDLDKGMVQDEPSYQLTPELWSVARNMRSAGGGMKSISGWAPIFTSPPPPIVPHFTIPIVNISQSFWVYTSLTAAAVWDGSTHSIITRAAGGAYNAGETRHWNGTIIGGLLVLNNGTDVPQYWPDLDITVKLLPIPAWPAGGKIAVLRAFQNYLVGINYTLGADNYPHLVKWSASVDDPGTIPNSWNEADETRDAGEYDLPDVNSGILLDARVLGSKLFLYKERATWSMRFIGGRAIFAFDPYMETVGILAPRCVANTGDGKKHIVATQDDIIVHDGTSNPESIVHRRMRSTVFNNMDTSSYINSFMYTDSENNEVVFCYPEHGETNPNRALVINYRTGALTEMDGVMFRNVGAGTIEAPSLEEWDMGTDTWDVDTGPWGQQKRNKLIACAVDRGKFLVLNDSSYLRDGTPYASALQRTGLSLIGRKRGGEWIVNHQIAKFVDRIWPKIRGGVVQIRIGSQRTVDGDIRWGDYQNFDPKVHVNVDVAQSSRAVAVEFSMPATSEWMLDGYRISITADGEY